MKTDRTPQLFTPPTIGTRTVVKDGNNGWHINYYDGKCWHVTNVNELSAESLTNTN